MNVPRPTGETAAIPRLRIGAVELSVLSDGRLRSTVAHVTGATPPEIARSYLTPDARGDIWLGLNCVLVRTPDRLVLVDTGFGDGPLGDDPDLDRHDAGLSESLQRLGISAERVELVINTHLHADHAGGNLAWDAGSPRPAFPNAEYLVQSDELRWALSEDPRDCMLYAPGEVRALAATGRISTCDGNLEVAPGIRVQRAPGHSPGHQVVIIESDGATAVIAGDLAPLRLHLEHPGWQLPGDLDPPAAVRSREALVGWAASAGAPIVSYHEPDQPFVQIGASK